MDSEIVYSLESYNSIYADPTNKGLMNRYKKYFDKYFYSNSSCLNYASWIQKMNLILKENFCKRCEEYPGNKFQLRHLELIDLNDSRIKPENMLTDIKRPRCYFLLFVDNVYQYLGIVDWTENADIIMKLIKNRYPEELLTFEKLFDTIVDNLDKGKDSHFNDDQFEIIDSYIDEEIKNNNIVKIKKFDFRCEGWVNKINDVLSKNPNNDIKLEASNKDDPRIKVKSKGQACYFIYYKNNLPIKTGILCWTLNMITLFDEKFV